MRSYLLPVGLFALAAMSAPLVQLDAELPPGEGGPPPQTPGRLLPGNPAPPRNPYIQTGTLHEPEPMPYVPAGGVNVNPKVNLHNDSTLPVYQAFSDFDWFSLALGLYQEYIELDLFKFGLQRFSAKDFEQAGLRQADRDLIQFMANQEIGHAISNMLGPQAPKQCEYRYPFKTVPDFIDFCQRLTRWGESGVYGFLPHMDSRPAAQMLLQSITTEARQQLIFRQFEGLFPMPVWFEVGVPQSFAWTMLAPWIKACPPGQHLPWQNFPALVVKNGPTGTLLHNRPAISQNTSRLSYPGRVVEFYFEDPGKRVGPNLEYITNTTAGRPKWAAWISQLNTTYTPLYEVWGNTAKTRQPAGDLYSPLNPMTNGTIFLCLTDDDIFVTPHNLSLILPHVRAGPNLYQVH